MKTNLQKRRHSAGYSLVEVVVASTVLLIGVGAACVLSHTMIGQEETHVRAARANNVAENATRLYQLGFSGAEAKALLPPDPMIKNLTVSSEQVANLAIGDPEYVSWSLEFYPIPSSGVWTANTWGGKPDTSISGNSDTRTLGPVKAYRSSMHP